MRSIDAAIFAALDWEAAAVRQNSAGIYFRMFPRFGPRAWGGLVVRWRASPVTFVLFQTGVGPERAAAAAAAAPAVGAFLAVGCAGGLSPTLRAGDLVVASEIVEVDAAGAPGRRWPAAGARVADTLGPSVRYGPLASSAVVLADVRAKTKAAACGALAVAMEDGALAAAAGARGIPFVAVRAVVDAAGETVPDFGPLIDERSGDLQRWRALRGLVGRPARWPEAVRWAWKRRRAARSLRTALGALLRGWPPRPFP